MFQSTEAFDSDLAAAAVNHTAAGNFDGPLRGAKVGLIADQVTLGRKTALSNVTKPTYVGYAEVASTFGAAQRDPSGDIVSIGSEVTFAVPDATAPQTIYGWYLLSSDGTKFYGGEIWAAPINLNDPLDPCNVVPVMDLTAVANSKGVLVN